MPSSSPVEGTDEVTPRRNCQRPGWTAGGTLARVDRYDHGRIVAVRWREAVEAMGSFLPLDLVDGRSLS